MWPSVTSVAVLFDNDAGTLLTRLAMKRNRCPRQWAILSCASDGVNKHLTQIRHAKMMKSCLQSEWQ